MIANMQMKPIAMIILGSALLAGCGAGDVEINAPILESVGITTKGKKEREPDLPQRAALVVPPSSDLPPPGERTQVAASQAWVNDPDQQAKAKAKEDEAAQKAYCANGEWNRVKDGGIDGWNKTVGGQQRCQSSLGEALNKSFKRSDGDVNQ